jgi:hypothetical protein
MNDNTVIAIAVIVMVGGFIGAIAYKSKLDAEVSMACYAAMKTTPNLICEGSGRINVLSGPAPAGTK